MNEQDIKVRALAIARSMQNTSTELRGNVLQEVANQLGKDGYNYTASLFEQIAKQYGVNPNV